MNNDFCKIIKRPNKMKNKLFTAIVLAMFGIVGCSKETSHQEPKAEVTESTTHKHEVNEPANADSKTGSTSPSDNKAVDKASDRDNDVQKPLLQMKSPTAHATFNNGSTISIQGITSDASLHKLKIRIMDGKNVLFSESPKVHDLEQYEINTSWKVAVTKMTVVNLVVEVEDHDDNVERQSIQLHLMP
jgi:altronate dehydratase